MDFRSSAGVFGDFWVDFCRFEILENDDFLMLRNQFGLTWNLPMLIWACPGSCFHVSVPDLCQNEPKICRVRAYPVVLRESHDYHRISHGLKPSIQWIFWFWSPIWSHKPRFERRKKTVTRGPPDSARRAPLRRSGRRVLRTMINETHPEHLWYTRRSIWRETLWWIFGRRRVFSGTSGWIFVGLKFLKMMIS